MRLNVRKILRHSPMPASPPAYPLVGNTNERTIIPVRTLPRSPASWSAARTLSPAQSRRPMRWRQNTEAGTTSANRERLIMRSPAPRLGMPASAALGGQRTVSAVADGPVYSEQVSPGPSYGKRYTSQMIPALEISMVVLPNRPHGPPYSAEIVYTPGSKPVKE